MSTSLGAVLVTDAAGRVLVTEEPGGALPALPVGDAGPRAAAATALWSRARLVPRLGELLVVDWADGAVFVFDGGRASRNAVRRLRAVSGYDFVSPTDLAPVVSAALAARSVATGYNESGQVPAALAVMRAHGVVPALHSGAAWRWCAGPVPDTVRMRQVWVWVFAPDGRVLLYRDDKGDIGLPGGTLEDYEYRNPVAAAVREVREETQVEIGPPVYLGHVLDEKADEVFARVRMAAIITDVRPSAVDPATGTVHRRLLVPPELAVELCGWGAAAGAQLAAALDAGRSLGITPAGADAPAEEIPPETLGRLSSTS